MTTKKQKTDVAQDTARAQPARIFDVARPGALAPEGATTRPVIVTNRVVMQDPMMAPAGGTDPVLKPTAEDAPAKLAQRIVIHPLTDQTDAAAPADGHVNDADGIVEPGETKPAAAGAPESKDVEPETPKPAAQPVAAEPAKQPEVSAPSGPEPAAVASAAPAGGPAMDAVDPAQEAAKLEADAKAQDEIDSLVADKTYFLPINSVVQRRSRHVFIFGTILILILAAAWLDIALDAGFISIGGLHPLTHLFSN